MMQSRNTTSQSRMILIGCILLLLMTGVLYFLKRVEANKLYSELSGTKVEKRDSEKNLNAKLTDYLQKMDEMTKQLGDLKAKQSACQDSKKDTAAELETAKNAVTECQDQQSQHVVLQGELEDELANLKSDCDGASNKAKEQLVSLTHLQQAARDSEIELDSCQTQATQCQSTVSGLQTEMVQLTARCDRGQQQLQQQQQPHVVQQQQLGRQPLPGAGANLPPGMSKYQPPNQFQKRNIPVFSNKQLPTSKKDQGK